MLFHCLYEVGRVHQTLMCSCIKPCESLSEELHVQITVLQIYPVQISDLQFASCRWLKPLRILHNSVVIEVQSGHTVVALRLLRLLLYGYRLAVLIKLNYAKPLRVVHIISEHCSTLATFSICHSCIESLLKSVTRMRLFRKIH